MTLSQDLWVRQPPQYGPFEDTQEELDWYSSSPEGIDRDRVSEEVTYEDKILQEDENSEPSDGE